MIDISTIKRPMGTITMTNSIRSYITQVGNQKFSAWHLISLMGDDAHWAEADPASIRRMVRLVISKMIDSGELEVVSERRGNTPGVYKAVQK